MTWRRMALKEQNNEFVAWQKIVGLPIFSNYGIFELSWEPTKLWLLKKLVCIRNGFLLADFFIASNKQNFA